MNFESPSQYLHFNSSTALDRIPGLKFWKKLLADMMDPWKIVFEYNFADTEPAVSLFINNPTVCMDLIYH